MSNKKSVLILEGQVSDGDLEEFDLDLCENPDYTVTIMDDLYNHPEKLLLLKSINPDYIYIFTTGLYVERINLCMEFFYQSEYKPKAIIFHGGGTLDKMVGFAYDLIEKFNTRIFVEVIDLEEQNWMYEISESNTDKR